MQQTIPQYPSLQLPHHPLHTISTTNGITKTTEVQSTVDTSTAETVVATATIIEDIQTSSALTPWIFKGVNMAELFTKFQKAVQKISTDRLFFIESSVHELLALSDIFLLCPGQYSPLCIHIFIEDVLSDLNKELLTECMDFKQDTNDDACMKLSRIINNVESNRLSKDDAEIDLLMLGKSLNSFERSLVWGVKAGMRKLPLKPIKIRKFFGECELFTMYFDPILCALFSDPDKNVLLRWSNVTSDESREIRPDAIISEIYQRDFGPSCGYGEAKLARPTTDNHALCYDLLCLATLAKDTIDTNKLQAALAFQINGKLVGSRFHAH
ncbi:hypothetical protein G6F56_007864 [Rhizopus delemar]|nr:hypothetical protein G6F56_007864 [Rhizopus delemar]